MSELHSQALTHPASHPAVSIMKASCGSACRPKANSSLTWRRAPNFYTDGGAKCRRVIDSSSFKTTSTHSTLRSAGFHAVDTPTPRLRDELVEAPRGIHTASTATHRDASRRPSNGLSHPCRVSCHPHLLTSASL